MANPNLLNPSETKFYGFASLINTTSNFLIIENAAGSNAIYRIVRLFLLGNDTTTNYNYTLNYYDQDNLGGTATLIAKDSWFTSSTYSYKRSAIYSLNSFFFYLPEDSSLGVTVDTSNVVTVQCCYEVIA